MNCTILTRTNATKPRVASRIAGYRLRSLGQTYLFPDLRQRLHQTLDIRVGVVRRRRYPQHRAHSNVSTGLAEIWWALLKAAIRSLYYPRARRPMAASAAGIICDR
jgi:hypothetical protein